VSGEPGFTPEEMFELGDVVAEAFVAGLIPGTLRFSRAILGAGYRRVADPVPDFVPPCALPERTHYFVVGASEHHEGMFGWQCSCTKTSNHSYGELAGAFGDAVAHVPAGDDWQARGE
jgi:hypothetical protein